MIPTEQYEAILADFRQWLQETRSAAEPAREPEREPAGTQGRLESGETFENDGSQALAAVGLFDLVEAFTALRHELKLQTKSSRALQEQTAAAVEAMQAATAALSHAAARESPSVERAVRPLVETLADLDEAFRRGARAIDAARPTAGETPDDEFLAAVEEDYRRLPWWRRWAARPWREQALAAYRFYGAAASRDSFHALAQGFDLIRARLERALGEHGVERIETVGQQVNPHAMTVVGVVDDPDRVPGEIVEEVRAGYHWKGAVLRFAEVVAVREDRL